MESKLVCEVDVEGTEDIMIRGEERDNGDGRMVQVGIDRWPSSYTAAETRNCATVDQKR